MAQIPEAEFYEKWFSTAEERNKIDTVEKCQEFIDLMEDTIPHDQMPQCYNWIVATRNQLQRR